MGHSEITLSVNSNLARGAETSPSLSRNPGERPSHGTRLRVWRRAALALGIACLAAAGCGTRSDLLAVEDGEVAIDPTQPDRPFPPGGTTVRDAGTSPLPKVDAGTPKPVIDAGTPKPVIDASAPKPVIDAGAPQAVPVKPAKIVVPPSNPRVPLGCEQLADHAYVLTSDGVVYSFNPDTLATQWLGVLNCGAPLNSMAVARTGQAYVSAIDGSLFGVDLAGMACKRLPFNTAQLNLVSKYGMGFVADPSGAGESLYVVEEGYRYTSARLAIINLSTYRLEVIGTFPTGTPAMEVTGTGDGRLFGFRTSTEEQPASLVALDRRTAATLSEVPLDIAGSIYSFHFAFWGGGIYIFAASGETQHSTVYRLNLYDRSLSNLGQIEPIVVGAGVSTCAPL